jgi:hypothetical protein
MVPSIVWLWTGDDYSVLLFNKNVRFGTVVFALLSGSALLFVMRSALLFAVFGSLCGAALSFASLCGSELLFNLFGTLIRTFVRFGIGVRIVRHCY